MLGKILMCCRYPVFIGINVNVNVNVNVRSELELKLKLKGMLLYKHIVKYLDILMIFLMFSKAHLFKEQHLSITDLYAPGLLSPPLASGGVGCKGHERTRCTPHFRSTSHCDGDAKHRQDSCGEYNCLIQ